MSHDNVPDHFGTCDVCGRENVTLRWSRNVDRKTGLPKLVCCDEFACFQMWQRGA